MEKRRHQRMEVDNLNVDISDGVGFFGGTISDLSRFGIKVDNLPKRLDDNAKQLSIVISGKGKNFKIKARPRWTVRQPISKSVGIEIVNAPFGWTEFVMDFEPTRDEAWGEIHI
ncbi:MAG: PilZ domain-containing protein [Proteobacteria bacterium]|nr:PilZ domain-containing protein [Pseudomonadota bacterium]